MNEQELQQLAELINTKWPDTAVLFGSGLALKRNCETFHLSDTDSQNAKFVIWCLDRLEELGLAPLLRQEGESYALVAGSDLGQGIVEIEEDGTETVNGVPYVVKPFPVERVAFTGATRAEACALALLCVLSAL